MDTRDLIALAAVYAIIVCSLIMSLRAKRSGSGLDSRKIVHVGVGLFVLVWWAFSEGWIMLVFFVLPFAVVLLAAMFDGNPISESELGDISNRMGHRTGLFLYVVSIGILVVFFEDHWAAATIGVVAMTFGDAAGSIIGRRWGRHPVFPGKSAEGSLAVFAATALATEFILLYYGWLSSQDLFCGSVSASVPAWACCIIAGTISSIAEMLCPGQLDNLANPLSVAIAMALLGL